MSNLTVRDVLEIWTVYENPSDHPGKFVVRKFHLDQPTDVHHVEDTLEAARKHVPFGLIRLPRSAGDDPVILEVWL